MRRAPKGMRLQIGIFGRRNVGKSSLLNALTRQESSIVSDVAGTTTDPVEKAMELLPIGPVLFIDTAGIDEVGALGAARVERTRRIIERADIALLVTTSAEWNDFEEGLVQEFVSRGTPVIAVVNKTDQAVLSPTLRARLIELGISHIQTIASEGTGVGALRKQLVASLPADFVTTPTIVGDLIDPGDLIILVVPIDLEAPKGRLIMPQVQTIRDILDHDAMCLVVKERELRHAFDKLREPPALVVTDSQAFLKVAADTPDDVPLTSFSILFSRLKGDLDAFAAGAQTIDELRSGDKVLIAEACTHHPVGEDIGRVKIPRWLNQYAGGELDFHFCQGHDFPPDLAVYKLVVHCGSCNFNPRHVRSRIETCHAAGVPITNYGMAISYSLGIFERAMGPFN